MKSPRPITSFNPSTYVTLISLLLSLPVIYARRRSFLSSFTSTAFSITADDWGVSDIAMARGNYTWLIGNYTYALEHVLVYQSLCSAQFSSPEAPEFKFYLCARINGYHNNTRQGTLYVFMYYASGEPDRVNVDMRYALLNIHGQPANEGLSVKYSTLKRGDQGYGHKSQLATSEFILDPANKVLSSLDQITVYLEYTAYIGWVSFSGDCRSVLKEEPVKLLGQDMARFKELGKYYDVTLRVMGQEMQAHKVILAARSSIFAVLFDTVNEDRLRQSSYVDVDDIKPEVMTEVLRYIYTNEVHNISIYAKDLLYAADEFDLGNLREMCEMELCENITPEIAYDVLILATKIKAERLRLRAARYINSHLMEIIQTPRFNKIINTDSSCISSALSVS
ncbi:hypothetical protein TSAR_009633 [Trichomalopsis sarcophagae]|uniref:BTB domain-containing protein n=1 Tax=Trichomalopsis sarcophagae TaxID=543379 RepID=A0A232EDA9_9HYME|nr:hypothetical protein TSAR_009633 [Trichomalopsis sarcophagae]